jgi:hypothetical protein
MTAGDGGPGSPTSSRSPSLSPTPSPPAEPEPEGDGVTTDRLKESDEVSDSPPEQRINGKGASPEDQDEGQRGSDVDEEEGDDSASYTSTESEEEPSLKYSRLGGNELSAKVFSEDSASAIAVSSSIIVRLPFSGRLTPRSLIFSSKKALGTHNGAVFILNLDGNIVKRLQPHSATVYSIAIDTENEFIGTASVDGAKTINQCTSKPSKPL